MAETKTLESYADILRSLSEKRRLFALDFIEFLAKKDEEEYDLLDVTTDICNGLKELGIALKKGDLESFGLARELVHVRKIKGCDKNA